MTDGRRSSGIAEDPGLLEREAELRTIRDAVDSLAKGALGSLLVFTGSAGLGKTSLLAQVRPAAEERGFLVLSARGGERERSSAFHVVRGLLQPVLAAAGEAQRRALLGSWYDIVGPALGLGPAPGGPDAPAAAAAPDPRGVRDGLDWVVTNLAVGRGPLVLVLDDAHWADTHSLAWLSAFAARSEGLPVLLVVAYRPDELPEDAEFLADMAHRTGTRARSLAALTPDAVGGLVRQVMGEEAEDAFCREVWAVTGGNPFETVEVVAKAQERGIRPVESSCRALRGLAAATRGRGLVARLQRLGSPAVRLAWAVAVLGMETPLELAGAAAALSPDEAEAAAERLRAARILSGQEVLEFVHPLIATAVYRSIAPATRVALHGRAAWTILEAGGGPEKAARHLLETRPEGDPAVVAQLRAAARVFMQSGAPESAQACLARALREPPDLDERAEVLYELGCSTLLYDPAATANQLRIALDLPVDLPPRLREDIVVRLAQALAHSDDLAAAGALVAEEAQRAESARTRLRLQVWHFMWGAFDAYETDSPARSRRLAALAARLGAAPEPPAVPPQLGAPEGGSAVAGPAAAGPTAGAGPTAAGGLAGPYLLGLRAWDAVVRGEPAQVALRNAELAQAQGRLSWVHQDWSFEIPVLVALAQLHADRPERAEALFAEGIAECEEAGWRGAHLAFGKTLLGYIRLRAGRLDQAEQDAREGLELADRVGEGVPAHWYAINTLIQILIARGNLPEALALTTRYRFRAPWPRAVTIPDAQTVYGELLHAAGDHRGAIRELVSAGARLDERGMLNPAWCPWLLTLAQAYAAVGETARAREAADEAVARAERFGARSAVGAARHVRAGLAAPGEDRIALLRQAAELLLASPARHASARAVLDLGLALQAAGRETEAADELRLALDLAESCAATPIAARAAAELALPLPAPGVG